MLDIANINDIPIINETNNFDDLKLNELDFGVRLKPITFQAQFQGNISFYDMENRNFQIPKEIGRLVLKTNPDNGFLLKDYKMNVLA
jgi:hypothetical protein